MYCGCDCWAVQLDPCEAAAISGDCAAVNGMMSVLCRKLTVAAASVMIGWEQGGGGERGVGGVGGCSGTSSPQRRSS